MPAHGRHGRAAAAAPVRRFGPFTLETLLVLGLIFAITGGSFVMSEVRPTVREQKVVVGGKTVKVRQAGTGGVLPGVLEPRVIPVVVTPPPTIAPTVRPTKAPKKPKPTPTPTAEVPLEPDIEGPGPLIPPGPGPGEPGQNCTLGLLCSPEPDPATVPDEDTEVTEPTEPDVEDPATAAPTPKPTPEPTPKKKRAPANNQPAGEQSLR